MTVQLAMNVEGSIYTKRGHSKAMKIVNRSVMYRVKNQFLWKHFENVPETYPGAGGYRFKRRTAKYLKWKKKQVGHTKPNVLTGRLKKTVISGSIITATQHQSRLRAKSYFPMKEWHRRELEVISNREQKFLAKKYKEDYIGLANKPQYRSFIRNRKR